ncbi:hypothetical protein [Croceiramulus getboli]|nr:hypothetical protein P8624_10780 [Flavobacteriaceae bacterium YJPT1-3]
MKTIKTVLVALAFIATGVLSASTITTKAEKPTTISEKIGQLLEAPNFEVEKEMTAAVTFVVNDQDEIVVLTIDTDDEFVARYIKSRLNYKKLDASANKGEQFTVPVRIVPEEA